MITNLPAILRGRAIKENVDMDELISRKAAKDALKRKQDDGKGDLSRFYNTIIQHDIEAIMQLPPAEPQIIRCKECKYYGVERTIAIGFYFHVCELLKSTPIRHDDDFCSRAERRTE